MKKSKKLIILSLIVSFIGSLIPTSPMIFAFISGTELNFVIIVPITLLFLLTFFLCLAMCFSTFVEKAKKDETFTENWYKAKERIIKDYHLSTDAYTQVYYHGNQSEHSENFILFQKIIKNNGCKVYAKLDKYDYNKHEHIELIVKDKDGSIIHTETISNFIYFEKYFKKYS